MISVPGITDTTIAPLVAFQITPDTNSGASATNRILFVTSGNKGSGKIHEVASLSQAKELFLDKNAEGKKPKAENAKAENAESKNAYEFVEAFFKNYERSVHVLVIDTVANAIAKIGDERFDLVGTTISTDTALPTWKTWADSRFQATQQNTSQVFITKSGDFTKLSNFGNPLNDKHLVVLEKSVAETDSAFLGAVLGAVSSSADNDPALPFQRLKVKGVTPPAIESRFAFTERNVLLGKGVSTFVYNDSDVFVDMLVTTYKTDENGNPDTQFRDLNDILNASFLRRDLVTFLLSKYPRYKAGDDGGTYSVSANVLTARTLKAETVNRLFEWEERGLVQNVESTSKNILIEREGDRFSIKLPLNLISQARQIVGVLEVKS